MGLFSWPAVYRTRTTAIREPIVSKDMAKRDREEARANDKFEIAITTTYLIYISMDGEPQSLTKRWYFTNIQYTHCH